MTTSSMVRPATSSGELREQAPQTRHESPRAQTGATPHVSLVIPALNEAKSLPWLLEHIPACVDEEVLVDGGSVDDTVAVARRCWPGIRVVEQRGSGRGMALRTGFDAASGDYIVVIDANSSMHPREIDLFVDALDGGHDFVKGSRFLPQAGSQDLTRLRTWGSRWLTSAAQTLFTAPVSDLCYGYVAFRRDVLPALALTSLGFEVETELVVHAARARLRMTEVPSLELERRQGRSNAGVLRHGGQVCRVLVRERLHRGAAGHGPTSGESAD